MRNWRTTSACIAILLAIILGGCDLFASPLAADVGTLTPPGTPTSEEVATALCNPGTAPQIAAQIADVVVMGIVKQIEKPQWSRPRGSADDPFGSEFIVQPVIVAVDNYLKGTIGSVELLVDAHGVFKGEKVILFLSPSDLTAGNQPLWMVNDRYMVKDDSATSDCRNIPLPVLLSEINEGIGTHGK